METNRWKQIVEKEMSESTYVKPFRLKEDYAKVVPPTSIRKTTTTLPTEDMEKINRRILDEQDRKHRS